MQAKTLYIYLITPNILFLDEAGDEGANFKLALRGVKVLIYFGEVLRNELILIFAEKGDFAY